MRDQVRALICPSCGAPIAAGDRLCAHCQAELATVRCPSCFSLELAGGKVCSQCAATLGLEGIEGPMGVRCPRCLDVELVGMLIGAHHVGECLRCTGLFVEHPVLERITRRAEERAGVRLRPVAMKASAPETTTYLLCPRCGVHMGRKQFGERSGIVIDVCARDGVWFDRDELARAVDFVDAGGLARLGERDRTAASIRRLYGDDRKRAEPLPSYDMVGSFLASLLKID
jgi:Zn-finger nucleic acid-binding protein